MCLFVSPYDGSIVRNERNWKEDWIRLHEKSLIIHCRVSRFKLGLLIFNGRYIDHLSRWTCPPRASDRLSRSIYQLSWKRGEKKRKWMERKRREKFKHELWQTVCIDSGVNVGSFPFELTPVSREWMMLEGLWQGECTTSSRVLCCGFDWDWNKFVSTASILFSSR